MIRTTGEHIAGAILKTVENLGLDISNARGQGYDGCSAMASDAVGVQAIIKRNSPKALWVHIIGKEIIQRGTVEEIKDAKFFFNHDRRSCNSKQGAMCPLC